MSQKKYPRAVVSLPYQVAIDRGSYTNRPLWRIPQKTGRFYWFGYEHSLDVALNHCWNTEEVLRSNYKWTTLDNLEFLPTCPEEDRVELTLLRLRMSE